MVGERTSDRALRATIGNVLRLHCVRGGGGVLRHRRDNGRIRRAEPRVNLMRADHSGSVNGHHVTAGFVSCAQAPSRPEGPAKRGGGAKRSALHGAEHSSKLSHVMAGGSSAARTMTDLLPEPGLWAVAMCATCVRTLRARSALGSCAAGAAYPLQE